MRKVAVYNLPELVFTLGRNFAEGFIDILFAAWYCECLPDSSVFFAFVFLFFFSLSLCEDKVSVSSLLLSEFSLWQGDSGFVMRGV